MPSVIRGDDNFDSGDVGSSTDFGAVGTYCLATTTSGLAVRLGGATVAGSTLRTANTFTNSYGTNTGYSTQSLSGTWRLMGNTGYYAGSSTISDIYVSSTLWLRIS